ncbi:MAG: hypothetical protein RMJ53_00350 [Chitinophagales bacterium]|nr:hypothetical protein [Chitinophagales bacterium]MDW8272664.1 hypothetical protein [Chitinophagales bacterium]
MDSNLGIGSKVQHPKYGKGVVVNLDAEYYTIYFLDEGSTRGIARDFDGLITLERIEADALPITLDDIKLAVSEVLEEKYGAEEKVAMAGRWTGGKIILKPGSDELQSKEIPIETFFHKIVMIRDRLRVMEQQINAHKKLSDEEKVELQQYITRIYGSLTTFNLLFRYTEDQFKGTGGEK